MSYKNIFPNLLQLKKKMPQCSPREDQAKEGQSFQNETLISSTEMEETEMEQKAFMPVYCAGTLHKKCPTNSPGSTLNSQKSSVNTTNENHVLLKANNCYQIHFVQTSPQACHINSNYVSNNNHNQNHSQSSNNNCNNNESNSNNTNSNNKNIVPPDNMLHPPSLQVVEVAPHFSKINLSPDQQYTKVHSNITLVSQSGIQHTIIPLQTMSPYCIIEGLTSAVLPCVLTRSPTNQQAYIKLSNTMIQSSATNINKPQLLIQNSAQKTSVLQKASQVQFFPNSLSKSTSTCQNDIPKLLQNKNDENASVNEQKNHVTQDLNTNDTRQYSRNVKQLETHKVPEPVCQHGKSARNLQTNSSLEPSLKNSGDTICIQNKPSSLSDKYKTPNNKTGTDLDSSFDYTIEAERMVSSICNTSPAKEDHSDHKSDVQQDISNPPNIFTANKVTDTNFSTGNVFLDALQKSVALKEQSSSLRLQKDEDDWSKNTTSCTISKTVLNHENKLANKTCEKNYLTHNKSISMNSNYPDSANSKNNYFNGIMSNKETILFKEVAIKCCFDIEKMIQNSELKYKDIEMECNDVRHSIFVSNKLQKLDYITDISSGILLLIKSWVSLNKHFENLSFTTLDQNRLNDSNLIECFMQWQHTSKLFIETLTSALRNDNNSKETKIHENLKIFCFQTEEKNGNSNKQVSPLLQKSCIVQDFTNTGQQSSCIPSFQPNLKRRGDESMGNFNSSHYWDTNCYSYLPKANQPLQLTPFHKDIKTCSKLGVNTFEHQQQNVLNSKSLGLCVSGCSSSNYSNYSAEDKNQNLSLLKDPSVFNSKNVEPFLIQNSSTPFSQFYNSADFKNKISPVNSDFQANALLKNQAKLLGGCASNVATAADLSPSSNISSNHDMIPLQYTSYDNCYQYSNNHQKLTLPHMTHPYLSSLPFYSFDNDDSENLTSKKTYLKPGNYNTPQKTTCSRTINNHFIIEDPPFSGVQFLYANSQSNLAKLCHNTTNDNSITTKNSDNITKKPEETWKAALASAESLCESLMSKPSETVNKNKQIRSQNNLTKSQPSDVQSTVKQKEGSDLKFDCSVFASAEPKFKIDNWLTQSLQAKHSQVTNSNFSIQANTHNSENTDHNVFLKHIVQSDKSSSSSSEDVIMSNFDFKIINSNNSKTVSDKSNNENKTFSVLSKVVQNDEKESPDTKTTPRKKLIPRKFKKNPKEDFAFGSSNKYNSKRVHNLNNVKENKIINQQTMAKLLEILDVVWKTDIKTLAKPLNNSDKDIEGLEGKIRCPLFLQAINYKLQSHGYESVDNVLIDFKKFFAQTHETNKDDEVCTELIKELEKIYITLVEKHFGINESSESKQNFGPVGSIPNIKLRKQKKTQRKC